jgi:hypothetical protein
VSTAATASVISRTPVAPSARGRGRACAIRRSSGSAANRDERAGQRPDRDQARGGDGCELLALHLAHEQALARAADGRDDDDPDEAGKDAGGDRAVPVGLFTQRSPAGRPGGVQRRRQQRRAERRQQRDRAVEADREDEQLRARARTCRQQRVHEARAQDASQSRCRDRGRRVGSCMGTRLARAAAGDN